MENNQPETIIVTRQRDYNIRFTATKLTAVMDEARRYTLYQRAGGDYIIVIKWLITDDDDEIVKLSTRDALIEYAEQQNDECFALLKSAGIEMIKDLD